MKKYLTILLATVSLVAFGKIYPATDFAGSNILTLTSWGGVSNAMGTNFVAIQNGAANNLSDSNTFTIYGTNYTVLSYDGNTNAVSITNISSGSFSGPVQSYVFVTNGLYQLNYFGSISSMSLSGSYWSLVNPPSIGDTFICSTNNFPQGPWASSFNGSLGGIFGYPSNSISTASVVLSVATNVPNLNVSSGVVLNGKSFIVGNDGSNSSIVVSNAGTPGVSGTYINNGNGSWLFSTNKIQVTGGFGIEISPIAALPPWYAYTNTTIPPNGVTVQTTNSYSPFTLVGSNPCPTMTFVYNQVVSNLPPISLTVESNSYPLIPNNFGLSELHVNSGAEFDGNVDSKVGFSINGQPVQSGISPPSILGLSVTNTGSGLYTNLTGIYAFSATGSGLYGNPGWQFTNSSGNGSFLSAGTWLGGSPVYALVYFTNRQVANSDYVVTTNLTLTGVYGWPSVTNSVAVNYLPYNLPFAPSNYLAAGTGGNKDASLQTNIQAAGIVGTIRNSIAVNNLNGSSTQTNGVSTQQLANVNNAVTNTQTGVTLGGTFTGSGVQLTGRYHPEQADYFKTPFHWLDTWANGSTNYPWDAEVRSMVDFVSTNGLNALNYGVAIDDGWNTNAAPFTNSSGVPIINGALFPNGFTNLTAYAHSKGVKIMIYSYFAASTSANGGHYGFHGTAAAQARQYADWGFDGVKIDAPNGIADCTWSAQEWSDAIAMCGRPMIQLETMDSLSEAMAWFFAGNGPLNVAADAWPIEATASAVNIWQSAQPNYYGSTNGANEFWISPIATAPWSQRQKQGNFNNGVNIYFSSMASNDVWTAMCVNAIMGASIQTLGVTASANAITSYWMSVFKNSLYQQFLTDPLSAYPTILNTNVSPFIYTKPMSGTTNGIAFLNLANTTASPVLNVTNLTSGNLYSNVPMLAINASNAVVTQWTNQVTLATINANSAGLYLIELAPVDPFPNGGVAILSTNIVSTNNVGSGNSGSPLFVTLTGNGYYKVDASVDMKGLSASDYPEAYLYCTNSTSAGQVWNMKTFYGVPGDGVVHQESEISATTFPFALASSGDGYGVPGSSYNRIGTIYNSTSSQSYSGEFHGIVQVTNAPIKVFMVVNNHSSPATTNTLDAGASISFTPYPKQ